MKSDFDGSFSRTLAILVVLLTLILVAAGGLVTSNDAALSVPDWPLSFGRLIPPLEGGIRYEFAHRLLAAAAAILIGWQAMMLRRRLAWAAFAVVIAQALLGGALVKLVDPKLLSIMHACLGQLCFGLVVGVAVELWVKGARNSVAVVPRLAVAGVFVTTILGAALRHGSMGPVEHIAGAAVATGLVMWACMAIFMLPIEDEQLRWPARLLMGAVAGQIFLGMAAYASRIATAGAPQPMPLMVWATVSHVVMGSLVLGAAIAFTMVVERRSPIRVLKN